MGLNYSDRQKHYRDRVIAFMDEHVYPAPLRCEYA